MWPPRGAHEMPGIFKTDLSKKEVCKDALSLNAFEDAVYKVLESYKGAALTALTIARIDAELKAVCVKYVHAGVLTRVPEFRVVRDPNDPTMVSIVRPSDDVRTCPKRVI